VPRRKALARPRTRLESNCRTQLEGSTPGVEDILVDNFRLSDNRYKVGDCAKAISIDLEVGLTVASIPEPAQNTRTTGLGIGVDIMW